MPSRKRSVPPSAIVSGFAQRLREVRAARGMTQRDLAAKAEVTLTYISRLEAGGAAPGIDLMERLAKALGTQIPELLPPLPVPLTAELQRKHVKDLFDALLPQAGQETLSMLGSLLSRLAESPAARR